MEEEEQNYSLEEFLKTRNVEDKTIQRCIDEKIDLAAVKVMTDEELSTYLPAHGDRLALKAFALKTRRKSLIEKLKTSFNTFGDNKENAPLTRKNKQHHQKATRMVEIGWRHFCDKKQSYKHVRGPIGGNRRISILKIAKAEEITERAIQLFFPDGSCPYGKINEFDFELQDYKCHKITNDIDVNEIYKVTGLSNIRFYLSTKRKTSLKNPMDDDDYTTDVKTLPKLAMRLRSKSFDELIDDLSSPINNPSSSISGPSTSTSDQRSEKVDVRSFYEDFLESQPISMDSSMFDLDEDNIYNLPESTQSNVSNNNIPDVQTGKDTIIIHRGHVFYEILDAMKQRNISFQNIQVEMILPNGSSENAEDFGGVLRDAISEFFITFYEVCTMGTEMKIPTLRHDFQDKEWTAIGKIIVESCLWQNYFPIKIAPVFIKSCLGQTYHDDEILENFLQYVSRSDSLLLKNALSDFDAVEFDDILDFCSTYEGKWTPNKENFKKLITQIAIEELIQKPNYVQACWQNDFQQKLNHLNFGKIFSKHAPTDTNILSMLKIPESLTEEKRRVVSYLKKFIKESDEKCRSAFLRFCTGSNLANGEINVDFNSSTGLNRAPVAHTCNSLLELPTTYENFMIFRSELNNILDAGVWVMDII